MTSSPAPHNPAPRPSPEQISEWITRHSDLLWRYAIARVRRAEIAEEVVQETFLAALQSAKDPNQPAFEARAGASGSTWLVGILRHKIADYYRRRARDRAGPGAPAAAGSPAAAAPPAPLSPGDALYDKMFTPKGLWQKAQKALIPDPAPDSVASRGFSDRDDFVLDLEDCAARLPEPIWEAFVLREALGVESDAICQQQGITPTNLWQRLHRARASLRDCLSGKGWFSGRPRSQTPGSSKPEGR